MQLKFWGYYSRRHSFGSFYQNSFLRHEIRLEKQRFLLIFSFSLFLNPIIAILLQQFLKIRSDMTWFFWKTAGAHVVTSVIYLDQAIIQSNQELAIIIKNQIYYLKWTVDWNPKILYGMILCKQYLKSYKNDLVIMGQSWGELRWRVKLSQRKLKFLEHIKYFPANSNCHISITTCPFKYFRLFHL